MFTMISYNFLTVAGSATDFLFDFIKPISIGILAIFILVENYINEKLYILFSLECAKGKGIDIYLRQNKD